MRRIIAILFGSLLLGAAAFQYSGVLSLPGTAGTGAPAANDQLVSLGPDQLLAVSYTNTGAVPCEQGVGANPPFGCGNSVAFTTPEFPKGDIESVVCQPIAPYTFASIDDCSINGNSGNVDVNIQVNQQPCDNPTLPFVAVVITKTAAAGGDVLTLSLTPSNCS